MNGSLAARKDGKGDVFARVGAFLASQGLSPEPAHYTFAYDVVTNPDGAIAQAVARLTDGGFRLSRSDIEKLGGRVSLGAAVGADEAEPVRVRERRDHASEVEDQAVRLVEATQAQVDDFTTMMRAMQDQTRDFGVNLAQSAAAMQHAVPAGRPGEGLDAIARITGTMLARVRDAEVRLDQATREADTLRAKLAEANDTARRDALTGLPNRRAFDETFERAFAEARRRSSPLGLLVVDADHFKRFNDRHGHEGGDRVLVALAGALSASARRPGDLVARLGGEEFAVLLPDTDAEGAARVAENVHEAVGCLLVEARDGPVGRITVSIGLAFGMPRAGGEAAELLRLADAALYEAKAAGRDRTCYALMADDAVPGEIASWMHPASDEAAPAHCGAAGRQPGGPLPFPLAS